MDDREALDVLGLRGPAAAEDVKRAYRRLARELHPDAGGDTAAFQRVRAAFEAIGGGTATRTGPAPQQRTASVDDRWWDAGSAWHDEHVERGDIDPTAPLPVERPMRADTAVLAQLVRRSTPAVLHSRSPGSRLHRFISWLDPDLLATVVVRHTKEGRRAGHDLEVEVTASGGRGRRLLAGCQPPGSWTLARGSETARLRRQFRPSRDPDDTAVRIAREVEDALRRIEWPLGEWFVLDLV